ncbi:unnamed protein product [Phyllotreta striolata]|uniref:Cytochrome b-c1 complex subunit 6 n=1 Tax=Phyllotreta striolata TaxID=444603 RepID=A0A9P0DR41_PHYSR|nr:unnamed protein product [Phyllotreta striolata]
MYHEVNMLYSHVFFIRDGKICQEPEKEAIPDPLDLLKDECKKKAHIKRLEEIYQTCNDRVNTKGCTAETCVEELFDLLRAIDKCIKNKVFQVLK